MMSDGYFGSCERVAKATRSFHSNACILSQIRMIVCNSGHILWPASALVNEDDPLMASSFRSPRLEEWRNGPEIVGHEGVPGFSGCGQHDVIVLAAQAPVVPFEQ